MDETWLEEMRGIVHYQLCSSGFQVLQQSQQQWQWGRVIVVYHDAILYTWCIFQSTKTLEDLGVEHLHVRLHEQQDWESVGVLPALMPNNHLPELTNDLGVALKCPGCWAGGFSFPPWNHRAGAVEDWGQPWACLSWLLLQGSRQDLVFTAGQVEDDLNVGRLKSLLCHVARLLPGKAESTGALHHCRGIGMVFPWK